MRASDLRTCDACRRPPGAPFYVVRVSLAIVDRRKADHLAALVTMFGGLSNPGALPVAEAFHGEDDVVVVAGDKDPALLSTLHLCIPCCAQALGGPLERAQEIDGKKSEPAAARGVGS